MRIGHGFDAHAFGPGDHIVVGGVRISYECGVEAHSDGDVLIHALCDALLGAAALGDMGKYFPSSDAQYANRASHFFLTTVYDKVRAQGWALGNADITLIAQAPRLAPHVPAMQLQLMEILQVDMAQLNIKATTTDGLGWAGRREGLAAHVVVLLTARSSK